MKRHSIETKAKVLAHLKTGASVREAAAAAGVPASSAAYIAGRDLGQIRTETERELGDQLLKFVGEILTGNSACARLLCDGDYLRQQKPHELAVLAGGLMDQAFKILEAMEQAVPGSAWRAERGGEPGEAPQGVVTLYELPANGRGRKAD